MFFQMQLLVTCCEPLGHRSVRAGTQQVPHHYQVMTERVVAGRKDGYQAEEVKHGRTTRACPKGLGLVQPAILAPCKEDGNGRVRTPNSDERELKEAPQRVPTTSALKADAG